MRQGRFGTEKLAVSWRDAVAGARIDSQDPSDEREEIAHWG